MKLDQWLASKRSVLATRINTRVWYNYLFYDLPKTHEAGPTELNSNFRPCLHQDGLSFAKTREEYVKQELYLLEQMNWVLEQVEFCLGLTLGLRSRLVEIEDTVGITKSKSKPTERQLAKVWEKIACEAKSCILTRLSTFYSTVTKDLLKVGQCKMLHWKFRT